MLLHITHIGRESTTSEDINSTSPTDHPMPILRRLLSEIIMPNGFDAARGWYPYVPAVSARHYLLMDSVAARSTPLHSYETTAITGIPSNFARTAADARAISFTQVAKADMHRVLLVEDRSRFGFRSRWDRRLKNWLAAEAKNLDGGKMTVIIYPRERYFFGNGGVSEIVQDDSMKIEGVTIARASQSLFDISDALKAGMPDASQIIARESRAGNADTPFADTSLPASPLALNTYSLTDVYITPIQRMVADYIARAAGLYDIAAGHDPRPSATIHRLDRKPKGLDS